jgi:methylenetetrahydrofolate reductase (NADPH)
LKGASIAPFLLKKQKTAVETMSSSNDPSASNLGRHNADADAGEAGVATIPDRVDDTRALAGLLRSYSVEVTSRDRRSLDAAPDLLRPGTEVFIAALPGDDVDDLVAASAQLKRAGLAPVPHIVARNIEDRAALDSLLARLTAAAGVDRALVLGGDRDKPAGEYVSSLELIETGLLQRHGIRSIAIGCYPEGHPKISTQQLDDARAAKLAAAEQAGLEVTLVSQFCFDHAPIIALARRMRAQGVKAPFRVGVAGPASRMLLIKYAMICGVGASMRFLQNKPELAKGVLSGETPEELLREVAHEQVQTPELGISGVHFFTFGSVAKSAQWAEAHQR